MQENHIFCLVPINLRLFELMEFLLLQVTTKKLLGVTIDSELKLENHIKELSLKVGKKNNAPCRISSSTSLGKRRTLMKEFIE